MNDEFLNRLIHSSHFPFQTFDQNWIVKLKTRKYDSRKVNQFQNLR